MVREEFSFIDSSQRTFRNELKFSILLVGHVRFRLETEHVDIDIRTNLWRLHSEIGIDASVE